MTNTQPPQDRPLVTFALFAYNQEKYIREAVEGAFTQTYEPLEIILSDDCSSDRTFEIMQEMAAGYVGPHEVRVRRNEVNIGILAHVSMVASFATGEIFLLAAGDDISDQERTSATVDVWRKGYRAIYSNYDLIDENGDFVRKNQIPIGSSSSRLPWLRHRHSKHFVYGATSAYSTEIVKLLPKSCRKIQSEDTPINMILQLQDIAIARVDKSLVKYRSHDGTISDSYRKLRTFSEIKDQELRDRSKARSTAHLMEYIKLITLKYTSIENFENKINIAQLNNDIAYYLNKSDWSEMGLVKRIICTFSNPSWRNIKWCLLRIFGTNLLVFLKLLKISFLGQDQTIRK